jgi:hypothetical protein
MSLKNATVVLTYAVEGSLASPGAYEYKERTTSGSILPEDQRLFIIRRSEDCKCFQTVHLTEAFVNWAISDEGRPSRRDGGFKAFKAYTFWRRMSDMQRLNYHIAKYVADMNATGGYDFIVNEE